MCGRPCPQKMEKERRGKGKRGVRYGDDDGAREPTGCREIGKHTVRGGVEATQCRGHANEILFRSAADDVHKRRCNSGQACAVWSN